MRRLRIAALLVMCALVFGRGQAVAEKRRPSKPLKPAKTEQFVERCVKFNQEREEERGVRLELHNGCDVSVTCTLSWSARCPGHARTAVPQSTSLRLSPGAADSAFANAIACGNEGWEITGVRWYCETVTPPAAESE
jgi:hypothetical protein